MRQSTVTRAFVIAAAALAVAISVDEGRAAEPVAQVGQAVTIPALDEVASIRIEAHGGFPGGPFEITLAKPEEIEPVLKWLKGIDWDPAKSRDARIIRIAPVAQIEIKRHKQQSQIFTLSNRIVIAGDRYWTIDIKEFAEVVNRLRRTGE